MLQVFFRQYYHLNSKKLINNKLMHVQDTVTTIFFIFMYLIKNIVLFFSANRYDLLTGYSLTCTYCPTLNSYTDFHRLLVRINPDSTKCSAKEQMSQKTGRVVKRKTSYMNPHVISFVRDFTEFDWQTD